MLHKLVTIAFLHVINSVPLDVEKSPEPFVIVAQIGDPFNENHDINVPEASIAESVYVVTPANFKPTIQTKSSPLLSRLTNQPSILKKIIKESSQESSEEFSDQSSQESSEEVDESVENEEDDDVVIKDNNHWRTESNFSLSDGLTVTKYKSYLTGLTIVLARAESPIVNGYFCLATEAMDNDGLPHTLEHLVFLGSEDYPYKEVLDLLANRALADRTNAWTDTDHTCYTVYTAGPSGFLHILPVYMDHILHPILREEDYLTEVHHINGDGQDAGVVYSEMQGVEQSTANIMYFSLAEQLYPESGYYAETGGYLANLRNSTNIKKVREYHKKFYRTENLVLTITGQMDEQDLFNALRKTEEKVLRKKKEGECYEFEKPWSKPLKKLNLKKDYVYEVEYPSEDETLGSIAVAWRLNDKISDSVEMLEAYKIVMKYLTATQVSPMEVAFVENSDPLATSVSADTLEVKVPSLLIEFENIPVERLEEVIPKMEKTLQDIVDNPEDFDLERITNFIDQDVINNLKEIENSPHLFVPDATVLDMLYGEKPEDLKTFVTLSQKNRQFLNRNSSFWLGLIRDQFINSPKIVLKGKPSRAKVEEFTKKEEERLSNQIEDLGKEGLEKKQKILDNAIESQELPSEEVLDKIPLGNVDIIKFRSLQTYNRTMNPDMLIDFDNIPLKLQVEDVSSNFVQMYFFLNTKSLQPKQKELLPLLLETWMTSPLMKGGNIMDIETVVKRRTTTLLSTDYYLGFSGSSFSPGAYSDSIVIEAQCERKKFKEAVDFISDVINYPHFTGVKINTTAANLLSNIPSLKLSATDVLRVLHDGVYFNKDTNIHYSNFVRQKRVLEDILDRVKDNEQELVKDFHEIVRSLATSENAFVYLASDTKNLIREYGSDLSVIRSLFNSTETRKAKTTEERFVINSEQEYRDAGSDKPRHIAFGVGGTESCFLKQSVTYNNTDWTKFEVAAERVMLQYLSDRMYDEVRGQGLTYGVSLSLSITEGRSTLSLTRSSRLAEAYQVVQEILERFVNNDDEWKESLVSSAKGSLIYSWTEKEETVEDLVEQTVKAYMRQTDSKYNREFVRALGKVTVDDVRQVARNILPSFLSNSSSQTVIVCPPSSLDQVIQDFKESGIMFTKLTNLEQTFLFD